MRFLCSPDSYPAPVPYSKTRADESSASFQHRTFPSDPRSLARQRATFIAPSSANALGLDFAMGADPTTGSQAADTQVPPPAYQPGSPSASISVLQPGMMHPAIHQPALVQSQGQAMPQHFMPGVQPMPQFQGQAMQQPQPMATVTIHQLPDGSIPMSPMMPQATGQPMMIPMHQGMQPMQPGIMPHQGMPMFAQGQPVMMPGQPQIIMMAPGAAPEKTVVINNSNNNQQQQQQQQQQQAGRNADPCLAGACGACMACLFCCTVM